MRWSQTFIPTLKESPSDAEIISHKLLLRAGLVRKLTGGLYTFLPMGLRVLRKIEQIIREELDRSDAQELLMPVVQPAELWQETGRWEKMGPEMLRMQDRNDRDFCLGPTHEEIITPLVKAEISSYRDLPKNFYQIATKFRNEIRPRYGLMRAREFIMMDSYSFDTTDEGAVRLRNGNAGQIIGALEWGTEAWVSYKGVPLAVGHVQGGELQPNRVFNL